MTHAPRPRFSSHFPQGANHFSSTMWKPNVQFDHSEKTVEPLICSGVFQSRRPFAAIAKYWKELKQPSLCPSHTLLQYFSWTLWIPKIEYFLLHYPGSRYVIDSRTALHIFGAPKYHNQNWPISIFGLSLQWGEFAQLNKYSPPLTSYFLLHCYFPLSSSHISEEIPHPDCSAITPKEVCQQLWLMTVVLWLRFNYLPPDTPVGSPVCVDCWDLSWGASPDAFRKIDHHCEVRQTLL